MRILIIMGAALLILSGCSNSNRHVSAQLNTQQSQNFRMHKIDEDIFIVAYESADIDPIDAKDLTLLRISTQTLSSGKEWFEILDPSTLKSGEYEDTKAGIIRTSAKTFRECGILACKNVSKPEYVSLHQKDNVSDKSESLLTIFTIKTGSGDKPESGASYNAQVLKKTLTERLS